jgi:hypothetical protein
MVASFYGPLVLKNRVHNDMSGLVVEFDAEIRVKLSRPPIKAKLRFDDHLRCGFPAGEDIPVFVVVNVSTSGSTGASSSNKAPVRAGPP